MPLLLMEADDVTNCSQKLLQIACPSAYSLQSCCRLLLLSTSIVAISINRQNCQSVNLTQNAKQQTLLMDHTRVQKSRIYS